MRERKSEAPHDVDELRIGALLRLSYEAAYGELAARMRAHGFEPMRGTIARPLETNPHGLRLTDLAEREGITKQSMAEIVDGMERAGYVERAPDPSDARARLVRFTQKGRRASKLASRLVRELEAEWAKELGARRFEDLKKTLRMVVAKRLPDVGR